MSLLRAKCPYCKTYTAVAMGPAYECHACGREFAAGLVRVPRAWGDGGDVMVAAASLDLSYPEVAVIEAEPRGAGAGDGRVASGATARAGRLLLLARRRYRGPLRALRARLALVWLDAHGDLNTPDTSPSGNQWGMPLRMVLDAGSVRIEDTVLLGARSLDPPEEFSSASQGSPPAPGDRRRAGRRRPVYVAFDADVMDPAELLSFMPEPGGWSVGEAERSCVRSRSGARSRARG